LLTAAIMLAGAPAQGATLSTDRPCYRHGEPVKFSGGPFSPNGLVAVSLDGAPQAGSFSADAAGRLAGQFMAPAPSGAGERAFRIAASDRERPAMSGSAVKLVSPFGVDLTPSGGSPGVRRRITARGFTGGGSLYAHVVGRRARRTLRIGRLTGPCGTLMARKRILRRNARPGVYKVQFDTARAYRKRTVPRAVYRVRVSRKFRLR
jgi:hypothetical protein